MVNDPYINRRLQMVRDQIYVRGVRDESVLNALRKIPRHLFVSEKLIDVAYDDCPLPIGSGQTISQPYIVAAMTDYLDIKPGMKVLEIGTGSGYQTAVLAELGARVFSLEYHSELVQSARDLLAQLNYSLVQIKAESGDKGWPEESPFDRIIVTCAPVTLPKVLIEQLAEGGKLVLPMGERWSQRLVLIKKTHQTISITDLMGVSFVPWLESIPDDGFHTEY